MSHDHDSDSSSTHSPPPLLNETVRVAKYIASLLAAGANPVPSRISSPMFSNESSPHDDRLFNLLNNNPKLKKDEAIIHVYILFVLFCYIIGTGLIVMKYVRKESPLHYFNRFPSRAISFTHMDSSEVWIKSSKTSSYDTVCENLSEEDDDPSERLRLSASSDVTYV